MSTDGRSKGMQYTSYNERKVVARLENTTDDALAAISSIFYKRGSRMPSTLTALLLDGDWRMKKNYMGMAKLRLPDVFDEDTGKQMAKRRCLDNYHKDFDSIICRAIYNLRRYLVSLQVYAEKHNIDTYRVPTMDEIKVQVYDSGKMAKK